MYCVCSSSLRDKQEIHFSLHPMRPDAQIQLVMVKYSHLRSLLVHLWFLIIFSFQVCGSCMSGHICRGQRTMGIIFSPCEFLDQTQAIVLGIKSLTHWALSPAPLYFSSSLPYCPRYTDHWSCHLTYWYMLQMVPGEETAFSFKHFLALLPSKSPGSEM